MLNQVLSLTSGDTFEKQGMERADNAIGGGPTCMALAPPTFYLLEGAGHRGVEPRKEWVQWGLEGDQLWFKSCLCYLTAGWLRVSCITSLDLIRGEPWLHLSDLPELV